MTRENGAPKSAVSQNAPTRPNQDQPTIAALAEVRAETESMVRGVVVELRKQAVTLRNIAWGSEAQVLNELVDVLLAQVAPEHERDSFKNWVGAVDRQADPATIRALEARRLLDRPTVGYFRTAFPRRPNLNAATADEALREDPSRLAAFFIEATRWRWDKPDDEYAAIERRVVELAIEYAANLGIADDIAEAAIADGVKQARAGRRGGGIHAC